MSMWSEKVFRNSELQVCYIAKGNGNGGGNIRHERVEGRKVGSGGGT